VASEALDIHPSDLYSGYSYDYPMELQQPLFRHFPDSENTISKEVVVPKLNRKAKWYKSNKRCSDCNVIINDRATRCNKCNSKYYTPRTAKKSIHSRFINRVKKYKHVTLSEAGEQVLLGSLLGDGNLYKHSSTRYNEAHSAKQKEYLEWKREILSLPSTFDYYKRKDAYRYSTVFLPQLNNYRHLFYPNGKKVVTRQILNKLKPLAIAVWYMDDGHYGYGNNLVQISTDCFSFEEHKIIQEWFKNKFGIECKIKKHHPNSYNISFYRDRFKFLKLIEGYVLKSMDYKLGKDIEKEKRAKRLRKEHNYYKNPLGRKKYIRLYYQKNKELYKTRYIMKRDIKNSFKLMMGDISG